MSAQLAHGILDRVFSRLSRAKTHVCYPRIESVMDETPPDVCGSDPFRQACKYDMRYCHKSENWTE
jgi:hypothetical protein